MATYGPSDEFNYVREFVTTAVDVDTTYDFGAAGYAANAILNIAAQGQVQVFGSTDPNFATNNVTVTIGGVSTLLDGTALAFMSRHATVVTKAYFVCNLPAAAGVYYLKFVFSIGAANADRQTHVIAFTVSQNPV